MNCRKFEILLLLSHHLVKRNFNNMVTRSSGTVPKQPNSAKKRTRRNLAEQFTTNFGGHSPTPNDNASARSPSAMTLSSQSIPATRPLAGFEPNTSQNREPELEDRNDDVIEVDANEQELADLIATSDQSKQVIIPASIHVTNDNISEHNIQPMDTNAAVDDTVIQNRQPIGVNDTIRSSSHHSNQPIGATADEFHTSHQSIQPNGAINVAVQMHGQSSQPIVTEHGNGIVTNRSILQPMQTNHSNKATAKAKIQRTANMSSGTENQQFILQHGPNYQGHFGATAPPASALPAYQPNPPPNTLSHATKRTVFGSNIELQLPSKPFHAPPLGMIQVNAPLDTDNGQQRRAVTDFRMIYLQRLREIHNQLLSEPFEEAELKTMLERAINFDERITKFVESQEDQVELPAHERATNREMWAESTDLTDRIKINVNTKLTYLQAGTQPNLQDRRHIANLRRLQAKLEPFGGNLEQWINFKAKWLEFYHTCEDLSELELFVKLDEFITPYSEAYNLIANYDRAMAGAYQDAWNELCARYDNPRHQVEGIISKLLDLEPIKHNRDDYLRAYTTINAFVHTLPRMNIDVSTWDAIIIQIVERRMQDEVFGKWSKVRTPREIPRLQEFIDFLVAEIDRNPSGNNRENSCDRVSNRSGHRQNGGHASNRPSHNNNRPPQGMHRPMQPANRSSTAPPPHTGNASRQQQASHSNAVRNTQPQVRSAVHKVFKCAICNVEQHKTYQCPIFDKTDRNGRIQLLRQRKLCENCMRPNCHPNRCTLRCCTNTGCEEKHNRLICPLTFAPTVNNGQTTEAKQA